MIKRNTIITLCALCALIPAAAHADPSPLLTTCLQMLRFWTWLKQFIYIMSACGLALISFQASILGRFNMGGFVSWGFGLFVLTMTEPMLAFLTSSGDAVQLHCRGIISV